MNDRHHERGFVRGWWIVINDKYFMNGQVWGWCLHIYTNGPTLSLWMVARNIN